MGSNRRRDIIQAVRIAAKEAAQTSTNPMYVEALELAAQVLENNQWVIPKRRQDRIKGGPPSMALPASSSVSDCCAGLVLLDDSGNYECVKCHQRCSATRSLGEAYSDKDQPQ